MTDLDKDITCKRVALALHPPGDPERAPFLTELSDSLYDRIRQAYSSTFLEEAIALGREALRLCPSGHHDRPSSLHKLARCLLARFENEDTSPNLEEAITLARDALGLCPPDHPDRSPSLNILARCLLAHFRKEHRTEDLEDAIALGREALGFRPLGHPDRSESLHNLAVCLAVRFDNGGRKEDIEEAITLGRAAIELRPLGHPERHCSLDSLASFLYARYVKDQISAKLDAAIKMVRAALDLSPVGHSGRSPSPHSLTSRLADGFDKNGGMEDTANAPPSSGEDHHLPRGPFNCCASFLHKRHCKTADLDEAITLTGTALNLRVSDAPDKLSSHHSLALYLANRFDKDGRAEDIKDATTRGPSLREGLRSLRWLRNLLSSIHTKYGKDHDTADLGEAITLARDSLDLRPLGHPDRLSSLQSLALYLANRFDKDGCMDDIDDAITFGRSALTVRSSAHSDGYLSVESLRTYLRKRYCKIKTVADLEEIITLGRTMLELRSQDHPERSCLLMSLENDIVEMMDKPRTEVDLDKAIALGQEILVMGLPDNPRRSAPLRKLIDCIEERFQKQDAIADLDELVVLHQNILELHPPDDQARSSLLHDLAHCLWRRFLKQGETSNLEEAITFERAALGLRQEGHADRAESLHTLVRFLGDYSQTGKDTDLGELIALGCAILELGQLEHPDHALSLRKLALWISYRSCEQVVTVDTQKVITLMASTLRLCPLLHNDRLVILKTLGTFRRRKLRVGSKADPGGIKKLVRDVGHHILQSLPTRLLNTLTGRLCCRDALISDFESSTQCKELLASVANSLPLHREECIQDAVSTYFQYVTLSHRWGLDEPILRAVQGQVIYDMELTDGIIKLQAFCAAACEGGYMWAWSDTCCIDKESSAELQEAIGRMFGWYRRSALTIVYLSDVPDDGVLFKSVWFERGWTLQELLAPHTMLFFTQDWSLYGGHVRSNHKEDSIVLAELEKVTNIASHHLTDFHPGMDDARSRLHWASTRCTTRPEDMAYSLFGVFNLHLPVIYGESNENALGRLLAEIISRSGDISVLDWVGEASPFHSCFPAHIATYRGLPCSSSHTTDQISSSTSEIHSSKALDELFHSLSTFDPPQFIGRRLRLPCITHRVTAIQLKESRTQSPHHVYEIRAKGLSSSELVLPNQTRNNLCNTGRYVLIRPWHSKLLDPSTEVDPTASEQLIRMLGKPFHALLLEELPRNEYQRIASSSIISARPTDVASILCSKVQTLTIV